MSYLSLLIEAYLTKQTRSEGVLSLVSSAICLKSISAANEYYYLFEHRNLSIFSRVY